jgi:dTDP-4-amino-4,6-dideoxygalactose transaminase
MGYRIPFNRPYLVGTELDNVARALSSGDMGGDGPFTRECQRLLQTRFGSQRALLTTSCTAALEMTAMLCNLSEGDEVIMPSYTFVSTANAFMLRGAKPVFVDIRRDTLNLDESLLNKAITARTRAIVPVHYAGIACEMDTILRIAREHGLFVIEDAAQGVNATYKGAYLGTLGDFGTYSFHESKNFVCGEGGALLINKDGFSERAEIIREKGTNRAKFFRGEVDKYTWVDCGSSYVPADILAAILVAQLNAADRITQERKRVSDTYRSALLPLADQGLVGLPIVPPHCGSNFHMFYMVLNDLETRSALIAHLKREGILSVFHYVPLHTSPVGQQLGYEPGMLPVTEFISDRLLRLPLFAGLTCAEADNVIEEILSFFTKR